MTIGVLIIAHDEVGKVLLETAVSTLGVCPLAMEVLPILRDCDPDTVRNDAAALVRKVDMGDGVLVLTDMYGSTPSNIACGLAKPGRVEVIAGVNLPMLIRILNYPSLSLPELIDKAISGGHEGILACNGIHK